MSEVRDSRWPEWILLGACALVTIVVALFFVRNVSRAWVRRCVVGKQRTGSLGSGMGSLQLFLVDSRVRRDWPGRMYAAFIERARSDRSAFFIATFLAVLASRRAERGASRKPSQRSGLPTTLSLSSTHRGSRRSPLLDRSSPLRVRRPGQGVTTFARTGSRASLRSRMCSTSVARSSCGGSSTAQRGSRRMKERSQSARSPTRRRSSARRR
jgi:hypothetical protein